MCKSARADALGAPICPALYERVRSVQVLEKRRMKQADDIERVGREIQILKLLRHDHVVRLWEIIHTPARIYLVMEFAARGELFQVCWPPRAPSGATKPGPSTIHQPSMLHGRALASATVCCYGGGTLGPQTTPTRRRGHAAPRDVSSHDKIYAHQ